MRHHCVLMHSYLLDGTVHCDVSVLLVHVVVASPGLIPHPHTKVLDLCGVLLSDLQRTPYCVCHPVVQAQQPFAFANAQCELMPSAMLYLKLRASNVLSVRAIYRWSAADETR